MANLHKPGDQTGYDGDRNLQIMSLNMRTTFYLVAGAGLEVSTDDEDVAVVSTGESDNRRAHRDSTLSGWEKDQVIRVVSLAAKSAGSTQLRATLDGNDQIEPLTIRVLHDASCRQVGKATAQVTPELRQELQSMSLRDAVIRVAEDQMHSAIAKSNGFGVYNMASNLDWCGGFAYWCWDQACAIRGEDNPFGAKSTVLWSPQRAIDWAMETQTPGQLLRYQGVSPMDGSGQQEYCEIGWHGYDLKPADIVLLRAGNAGGWKHVCMVHEVNGRSLVTIDGNQGSPSIKLVNRSLDEKLADGSYQLVFIAVMRS